MPASISYSNIKWILGRIIICLVIISIFTPQGIRSLLKKASTSQSHSADKHTIEEISAKKLEALVEEFFQDGYPQFYEGDLKDEANVLKWMQEQQESDGDVIELVTAKRLKHMLKSDDIDSIAVFFYDAENCDDCDEILAELENIDDDTDKHDIHFVKCEDETYAMNEIGLTKDQLPALVYFEDGEEPSIYDDDLLNEEEVLKWLIEQKTEETIENVNRNILMRLIDDKEYLAVLFFKDDDEESDDIVEELEKIDDECEGFEISFVKIDDPLIAKKYGIRNPPGLVYFRHGKPLKYTGDLLNEEEVLDWLTKPENMELSDKVEKVNRKMLQRLMGKNTDLAVLFYSKDNCPECAKALEELEKIDDEADEAGIKLVKVDDDELAKEMGVFQLPGLVFFNNDDDDDDNDDDDDDGPTVYAGDMKKGEKIYKWMMSQLDPNLYRIEDADGAQVRELIENSEQLAIYFYAPDCEECEQTLEVLETIDDDTDTHGIAFVKTQDEEVAEELGVNAVPALVYVEKGRHTTYQVGEGLSIQEVLELILQEKTEQTIKSVYILGALTAAVLAYTIFLLFCLKKKSAVAKKED